MRSVSLIKLLSWPILFLLMLIAALAQGPPPSSKINPHTQIRWPVNCSGDNFMTYNFTSNTCFSGAVQIAAGTTTTLPAGAQATVTQTGTFPSYTLNFGIPTGTPGGSLSYPGVTTNNANGLNVTGNIAAAPQGPGFGSITCWGDSLTAGTGGTPYCSQLATLTGRTTYNLGIGGQRSGDIAVRANAYAGQSQQTFGAGFTIPTSGTVTVTWGNSLYNPTFQLTVGTGLYSSGFPLSLTVSGTTYTMNCVNTSSVANTATCTPTSYPGSPVAVASGTQWLAVWSAKWGAGTNLIRVGRNNYSVCPTSGATPANCQVAADIVAMVAKLPNYRVLGVQNGDYYGNEYRGQIGYNQIVAINTWEAATYGNGYTLGTAPYYGGSFIDIRNNLVQQTCLQSDGVNTYLCGQDVPGIYVRSTTSVAFALSASMDAVQTTFSYTGGPTTTSKIDSEFVQLQAACSSGTCPTVLRGFGSSTAATHTTGAVTTAYDNIHENTTGYGIDAALVQAALASSSSIAPVITVPDLLSLNYVPSGSAASFASITLPTNTTNAITDGTTSFGFASNHSLQFNTSLICSPSYSCNLGGSGAFNFASITGNQIFLKANGGSGNPILSGAANGSVQINSNFIPSGTVTIGTSALPFAGTFINGSNGANLMGTTTPLLLNGTAGAVGQIPISQGPGQTPLWGAASGISSPTILSGPGINANTVGTNVTVSLANGFCKYATPVANTGSTSLTQFPVGTTCTIPAGTLGATSILKLTARFGACSTTVGVPGASCTGAANTGTCTPRIWLGTTTTYNGGTAYTILVAGALKIASEGTLEGTIANQSLTSQIIDGTTYPVGASSGINGIGPGFTPFNTSTTTLYINFTMTNSVAADQCWLDQYVVELIP